VSLTNQPGTVKRRYASPRRAAQSRATRRAIVDAAARLFAERGYVATSFDAIADAAAVGRATVFAHFPAKAALLKTAYDVTLVGDDEPIPLPERPESLAVRAERDPHRFLAGYAAIVTGVARRVSPIYEAIRGAAHADPEAAAVWRKVGAERRIGGANIVASIVDRGAFRGDIDPERAADLVFALVDPGLYHVLVRERGWPHDDFTAWLAATLQRELVAG
jgi:TetR/AcrR family transcriptional regulator, regulator of autoinduction and epiphytic fitness